MYLISNSNYTACATLNGNEVLYLQSAGGDLKIIRCDCSLLSTMGLENMIENMSGCTQITQSEFEELLNIVQDFNSNLQTASNQFTNQINTLRQ